MSKRKPCRFCGGEYTRGNPKAFFHGWIAGVPVTISGHRKCVQNAMPPTFAVKNIDEPGLKLHSPGPKVPQNTRKGPFAPE